MPPDSGPETGDPPGGDPPAPASQSRSQMQHATEPLACVSCRARKLKCDRTKPACTRCVKVRNECVYPESRRKPTFKRRNVMELEARLTQVEDYLKDVTKHGEGESAESGPPQVEKEVPSDEYDDFGAEQTSQSQVPLDMPGFMTGQADTDAIFEDAQLVGLGISESLPPFEVMEELNTIYFNTQHTYVPVLHPGRFWQAFYGPPLRKPPMCLQYAIWAMAAYFNEKYAEYAEVFYQRARQYAEADEMKGTGEHFITLPHAQAYALIATFEARCMFFTRSALTSAKCVRLVQMMGLDRLDGKQDDIPPTLGPVTSWVDMEERRRTFWVAFSIDSHASISTGWPALINSDDVTTRLPASEDAFNSGTEEQSAFLDEAFKGASYGGFAGTIVICRIFKAIMHHVHRSKAHDRPEDLMDGPFWTRHRELDNMLSSAFMLLPEKLRLPRSTRDPTAVHTNLNLHASVISLHHAAIEKAEQYGHVGSVKHNSLCRLKAAAEEVVNIVRLTCHNTAVFKSPLSALSLYCASTVYVYLTKDASHGQLTSIDKANLQILIQSMEAIGRAHPITRAFLQQICLDIERNHLGSGIQLPNLSQDLDVPGRGCSSIPMFARNFTSPHTKVSPVLPGKLPLDNPQGKARPTKPRLPKTSRLTPMVQAQTECFQAVLGAVTRNIAVSDPSTNANQIHKRKRAADSPVPSGSGSGRINLSMMGLAGGDASGLDMSIPSQGSSSFTSELSKAAPLKPQPRQHANIALPDRTNSSTSSSPMDRTETQSGSSHTSPGVFGLGNTAEENRVDLRGFQYRVIAPLWPTSAEESFFGQITESLVNDEGPTGPDGSDPWGILNEELDWGDNPTAM